MLPSRKKAVNGSCWARMKPMKLWIIAAVTVCPNLYAASSRCQTPNVKPGPPPIAAPERSDGAAMGGRAEALVGRLLCLPN
jgi:hypothetical protein